jgi:hypothetical protein
MSEKRVVLAVAVNPRYGQSRETHSLAAIVASPQRNIVNIIIERISLVIVVVKARPCLQTCLLAHFQPLVACVKFIKSDANDRFFYIVGHKRHRFGCDLPVEKVGLVIKAARVSAPTGLS